MCPAWFRLATRPLDSNVTREPGCMSPDFPLAIVHGINRALRPLDRALFAPRDGRPNLGPVFIVGPARSGTTLLFQTLAHATRVSYLPQALDYGYGASNLVFRAFGARMARHAASFESRYGRTRGLLGPSEAFGFWRQWFWKGSEGDHRHAAPLHPSSAAELRAVAAEISAHRGMPLLVKCLYLSLSVPALANAFPNARFIFATRDAAATAQSSLLARTKAGSRHAWWSTRPPGYHHMMHAPPQDQVLWQLGNIACTIRSDLASLDPGCWMRVRYEDLCEAPQEVLRGIIDRLGLDSWDHNDIPARFSSPGLAPTDTAARALLEASPYFQSAVDALQ